uniref:FXYD domain-containing ion transport regulator n=1 Tax=Oreochromis niloticus TaxID=8128 RepID=A0A669ELU5_ORENI
MWFITRHSFFAETVFPDQSDFEYDYETLRTTGVILAVIMFVSGILIALIPARLVLKSQRQKVISFI